MENMDYKNMDTKELLHLISNQVSNEEVSEQNKLVIQNCCKELFEKKCSKKYVKVSYYEVKRTLDRYTCPNDKCGSDCGCGNCDECNVKHPLIKCECKNTNYIRRRISICKVKDSFGSFLPEHNSIGHKIIEHFNETNHYVEDFYNYDCIISKIEEIEL
jgi:hypothetical protein